MDWTHLGIGISLVLIIEGLLPFMSPSRYRRMLELARRVGDNRLRFGGAVCMGAGVLFLYVLGA